MKDLVSIVTPSYNSSKHLSECINSVINQTYTNWEMIIVDDCSSDDSFQIAKEFSQTDSRIKTLQNNENKGSAISRNRAIKEAKGKYIAFLDSDDSWKPGKLEKQISYMETTGALFTYGDYLVVDKNTGEVVKSIDIPDQLSYKDLLRSCPIGCLTAAFNREVLGKVYMPNIRQGQDWGLWLALTRDGTKAYKYPGREAFYRVGENSLSANKFQKGINMYRIYKEEEKLGVLGSFWYLFLHTLYVIRK